MGLVGGACIQNSDSEETGQGQTINSYTNKPINKFKVHALLDDTLSCTHRVRVGLDKNSGVLDHKWQASLHCYVALLYDAFT